MLHIDNTLDDVLLCIHMDLDIMTFSLGIQIASLKTIGGEDSRYSVSAVSG